MDMALWDPNTRRGAVLKDNLDMFAQGGETALLPLELDQPVNLYDVVFLSFDDCDEPVLRVARKVRESSETIFMLLVSDRARDLSRCFRPKIRPSGVLFRPVKTAHIRDILDEIADELDRLVQTGADDVFIFKSEGVSHRVPFRDILFFKADNKKIVLHTAGQEIGYYDSMENLAELLPAYFVRCHRGYMANAMKIVEMRGAEMDLRLTGGVRVPFSRSCRDAVKQAMAGQLRNAPERRVES